MIKLILFDYLKFKEQKTVANKGLKNKKKKQKKQSWKPTFTMEITNPKIHLLNIIPLSDANFILVFKNFIEIWDGIQFEIIKVLETTKEFQTVIPFEKNQIFIQIKYSGIILDIMEEKVIKEFSSIDCVYPGIPGHIVLRDLSDDLFIYNGFDMKKIGQPQDRYDGGYLFYSNAIQFAPETVVLEISNEEFYFDSYSLYHNSLLTEFSEDFNLFNKNTTPLSGTKYISNHSIIKDLEDDSFSIELTFNIIMLSKMLNDTDLLIGTKNDKLIIFDLNLLKIKKTLELENSKFSMSSMILLANGNVITIVNDSINLYDVKFFTDISLNINFLKSGLKKVLDLNFHFR
eukprot:gene2007-1514_t